jgi:Protein required for attachment to host cells
MIRSGEWVVVCDGARALVLENVGDTKFPNLKTIKVFEQKGAPTRDLGTDAPGRSHSSVGHGRSAVAQTDWHEQAEEAFLLKVVEHLEEAVTAGKIKSMIMVAPPRALGVIRPACSQGLRGVVRAELDKDFVRLPVHEIEKHLTGA